MNLNSRVYPEGLFDKVYKLMEEERKNRIWKEENTRKVLIEKTKRPTEQVFILEGIIQMASRENR